MAAVPPAVAEVAPVVEAPVVADAPVPAAVPDVDALPPALAPPFAPPALAVTPPPADRTTDVGDEAWSVELAFSPPVMAVAATAAAARFTVTTRATILEGFIVLLLCRALPGPGWRADIPHRGSRPRSTGGMPVRGREWQLIGARTLGLERLRP